MNTTNDDKRIDALMSGATVVVSVRKTGDCYRDTVAQFASENGLLTYCGDHSRSGHKRSKWYNQFKKKKPHPDTGQPMTRDDVCDLFEERQLPFMNVEPLRGRALGCWCAPKRCHCDSIVKKLEETKEPKEPPMNLRNDKLQEAAELITKDHQEIQQLMATAEERAKAIGQKLVDLKPILKERGTNLTNFCKDYLPFGKSTAYDYIKIAEGKVTWEELHQRKNPQKDSAVAEKPGALPPTLEQHADAMGVPLKDVEEWEETRQAIKADPELSKKMGTFEGYMKAKSELEKRKRMEENPQVIDFDAAVKSKEHYSIRTSATSFVVAMEQMVSKSDDKDIKRELLLAIQTDPLNIKVPALFAMREVLEELCNEFDQPQVKKTH